MMEKDNINPAHYRQQPYECIEFTENMNFNMGNAFKYIWRYQDKNGTEDLKKLGGTCKDSWNSRHCIRCWV